MGFEVFGAAKQQERWRTGTDVGWGENQELGFRRGRFQTPVRQTARGNKQTDTRQFKAKRSRLATDLIFTHTNDTGRTVAIFRLLKSGSARLLSCPRLPAGSCLCLVLTRQ